jgi:hypothetical protein
MGGTTTGCLPGTRVTVLKGIWNWYMAGNQSQPVYWLKGDSGTGKSAIAYSLCQAFARKLLLGASFFFSRDQESRNKIDHVFVTLAYRLCFTFPQLRTRIAQALQDETLLTSPSLRRCLRELILVPIRQEAQSLASPIVIVIDALDECDGARGENSIVQFVDILVSELEALENIPLKFLVTSRPHKHLLRVFSRAWIHNQTSILSLHVDWDPRMVLDGLRRSEPKTARLDEIYCEVLIAAANRHPAFKERVALSLLLAFIVLSFDRLAAPDIDALLQIKSQQFLPILRLVINVPAGGGPLCALHASFHDFMVDPLRCVGTPIGHIDRELFHLKIAKLCLKNLQMLKRDLLNLHELQGKPLTEITNADVIDRVDMIPKELCYAVKYWAIHLACARNSKNEELLVLLEVFVQADIIHWVEALSYLGYLNQGITHLNDVMQLLDVS